MESLRKRPRENRAGNGVGEHRRQGERSEGLTGRRDNGYKQKAGVKRPKKENSHLVACCRPSIVFSLSLHTEL